MNPIPISKQLKLNRSDFEFDFRPKDCDQILTLVFFLCYLKESPQFHKIVPVHCDCVTDVTTLTTTRFQLTTSL